MRTLATTSSTIGTVIVVASVLAVLCTMLDTMPSCGLRATPTIVHPPGASLAAQWSWDSYPASGVLPSPDPRDCARTLARASRPSAPVHRGWG